MQIARRRAGPFVWLRAGTADRDQVAGAQARSRQAPASGILAPESSKAVPWARCPRREFGRRRKNKLGMRSVEVLV